MKIPFIHRQLNTCHCKSQALFRLRFHRGLIDYLLSDGSLAEGFGIVWEKTLAEVPIDDEKQGEVYRELILWVKSDKLFTPIPTEELETGRDRMPMPATS